MQENEFEKQVKQTMDEFKLRPSDEVWPKIDRRINRDRRRKAPFILLLVSCLMVAGFIMYRYEITKLNDETKHNIKETANNLSDENVLKDSNAIPIQKDEQTNKNSTIALTEVEKNKTNVGSTHERSNSFRTSNNIVVRRRAQSLQTTTNDQSLNQIHQQEVEQSTIKKEDASTTTINTVDNNTEARQQVIENKNSVTANSNSDVAKAEIISNNILNTDSVVSTKHNTSKKKTSSANTEIKLPNLQWGINAFYGGSNAVNGLVSSDKSMPAYLNSGSSGNVDTVYSNGKPYTASSAYSIGFVVEKRIIKNGFIGTGLNYVHLSTKSTVGNSIDSVLRLPNAYSLNSFYQSGTTSTYTNRYNFIELPVYFKQDLFPSKKIGLSYNAGFSLRQMISSNSLVYDHSYNIFYSDDNALHNTQLQFLAGLSLKINSSKSTSLYIGPQFSYSFSNIFKTGSDFHFINYGVQAGIFFGKK